MMKRRVSCLMLAAVIAVLSGCAAASRPVHPIQTPDIPAMSETEGSPAVSDGDTDVQETAEVTETPEALASPSAEPQPVIYTLSFAGDCTLGTEYASYNSAGSFVRLVGDDYAYPFANALDYFSADDFTIVNLECALTNYNTPAEKTYRFRGPPEYAKILTAGGVECVNLANNHSYDYGTIGYKDTKSALETEGVSYVENRSAVLYTTESGLQIGIYAAQFSVDVPAMKKGITGLLEQGAEIVIVSLHWGEEGRYRANSTQTKLAHTAIDAGADIVFGHHPHVLQRVESYNGGMIYYSLGNFSFGGNRNPADKDTAIIQQAVIREIDGSVHLGETTAIPFRLCEPGSRNNFKPTPYEKDGQEYQRAMSKLDGSFTGPDLVVNTPEPSPSPSDPAPEESPLDPVPPVSPEASPPADSALTESPAPEDPTAPDPAETTDTPEDGTSSAKQT